MTADSRYELLERVGVGSFATVYRARDNELGREVAVKQMHEQFLHLPEQMERYWQEAQLLASVQHPNIVTFFDINRQRGWLIMELMQSNLAERIAREPMDINSVRTTLAHCLRALKYLHARGIVHGDIKPSNMMIDARKRVKIGDFGLARRVSNADGSLLKGTTKYMAPETVSDEWGDVGPASDLYSLGFAAFELLCGPKFMDLFPGLSAFGRDQQIAWMMWHAARDRRLPDVKRVLQGVPDDLALVIGKLCSKEQSKRYTVADEALSDLNIDLKIVKQGGDEPPPPPPDKQRRIVAIAAFSLSLIMSLAMLFWPEAQKPADKITEADEPIRGLLRQVDPALGVLIVDDEADSVPKEIKIGSAPKILLNDKTFIVPRELQPGDHVQITKGKDDTGRPRLEISAARPDESVGFVSNPQPSLGQFMLQISEGAQRGELSIRTTGRTELTINGKPGSVEDVRAEDRATVRHVPDAKLVGARVATKVEVLQKRKLDGFIRDIAKSEITVEVRRQEGTKLVAMSATADCNVTINGKQIVDGKLLRVADLKAGDRVSMQHHKEILEVHALRMSQAKGVLLDTNLAASALTVGDANNARRVFVVGPKTKVVIEGQDAELADLRRNDQIEITYDSANERAEVSAIDTIRPDHENRFAIVIGNQAYDDNRLTKLTSAVNDAKLVQATLLSRYGCAPDRTLLLADETHVRITQAIPDWLKRTNPQSELLLYFVGHAYLDDQGQPYLAAKDFDSTRVRETGIALSWLRGQLESCEAGEKVLLLDASHAGDGQDLKQQPSSAAMLDAIKPAKDPGVFRKSYAIASCGDTQRGLRFADKPHGVFGWFLAQALAGKGDKNQDLHLEPTELFDSLKTEMSAVEITAKNKRDVLNQVPVLFRPNDAPPPKDRLTPTGRDAVRQLLTNHWGITKFTVTIDTQLTNEFLVAVRQTGDEPDAKLAVGLIRLKVRSDDKDALKYFDQTRLTHPKSRLAYEGLAWIHCYTGKYREAATELTRLCEQIKAATTDEEADASMLRQLEYAGRLREFMGTVIEDTKRPESSQLGGIDALVAELSDDAKSAYAAGRKATREKSQDYERRIAEKSTSPDAKLLAIEQKRMTQYVRFGFDEARSEILAGLEQ